MLRGFFYLFLGWVIILVVGGLAAALGLTIMLPVPAAIVLTHLLTEDRAAPPVGLFVAMSLGYVVDVHQGAPVGASSLAYGIVFLLARPAIMRLSLRGWFARGLVCACLAVALDLGLWVVLALLSEWLQILPGALDDGFSMFPWRALATALLVPPLWVILDWMALLDVFRTRLGPKAGGEVRP